MKLVFVFFLFLLFARGQDRALAKGSDFVRDLYRTVKVVLSKCHGNVYSFNRTGNFHRPLFLEECFRNVTLRALQKSTQLPTLNLPFGVKFTKDNTTLDQPAPVEESRTFLSPWIAWKSMATEEAARFLQNHQLRIPLRLFQSTFETARRRKDRGGMMGLILFSIMAMAIIAIPLGFQFLAVLGGKALLLAKLALILTSIQGLKKVATSDFSFGLYHSQPQQHLRPWLYDRRWQQTGPDRQAAASAAVYEGYAAPYEQHNENILDTLRTKIMLPRVGGAASGFAVQPHQQD